MIKKMKLYNILIFVFTRSQWAWAETADLDQHTFRPNQFLSVNILKQRNCSLPCFLYDAKLLASYVKPTAQSKVLCGLV